MGGTLRRCETTGTPPSRSTTWGGGQAAAGGGVPHLNLDSALQDGYCKVVAIYFCCKKLSGLLLALLGAGRQLWTEESLCTFALRPCMSKLFVTLFG